MKADKETLIVFIVCAILLTAWYLYFPRPQRPVKPAAVAVPAATVPAAAPVAVPVPEAAKPMEISVKKRAASAENKIAAYYFNSNGAIDEIVIKNAKRTGTEEKVVFQEVPGYEPFSCSIPGMTLKSVQLRDVSESTVDVVRTFVSASGTVTVTKHFTVSENSPSLNCSLQITGTVPFLNRVIVWGGTMAPLKQFSNDDLRDVHRAEYMIASSGKVVTVEPQLKAEKQEKYLNKRTNEPVRWVAVSNKYFLSQLYPQTPFNGGCDLSNRISSGYAEPGIGGVYSNITLPFSANLTLFSGAKTIEAMSKLPEDARGALHLAYWGWLEFLCRPMLSLLNFLKEITGSYGWAIILLTVLVKLVLWPLIHRGNKSMRRMSKIQPKLKELKEKYKDDQQTFNQKMWELYREEKVNPMGGCFPMLLQFPVFVALYSTLDSAVELRHVPFLWAQDLSQPDVIGPQIFGFGIHPLILLSTGLMVLQMKLQPQAGDPMQRKMMMLMPLFMLIFFYNFPSGLALYWTVNNILSILQMKFSQYAARKEDEKQNPPPSNNGKRAKAV